MLAHYARVFVHNSVLWGGGVANLVPAQGHSVQGALCQLTREQLARLDAYEAGYDKVPVTVTDRVTGQAEQALAYIMTRSPPFEAPPSEAYLCAIWRTLRETHGPEARSVPLLRHSSAGQLEQFSLEWRHPGTHALRTLRALCYEAGVNRQPPWELPRRAAEVSLALEQVGVSSAAQLVQSLRMGAQQSEIIEQVMDAEAVRALRQLLTQAAAPAEEALGV